MIGEIETFLDESVDANRPMFARTLARVHQHILDDQISTLAVLGNLVEIAAQCFRQFGEFVRSLSSSRFLALRAANNSSISSTETPAKLFTKLSGFLISWAMPAVN